MRRPSDLSVGNIQSPKNCRPTSQMLSDRDSHAYSLAHGSLCP